MFSLFLNHILLCILFALGGHQINALLAYLTYSFMCPFIHPESTCFPIPTHSPWDAKPLLAAKIVEVRDTSLASKLGPRISNMEFGTELMGRCVSTTKIPYPRVIGPISMISMKVMALSFNWKQSRLKVEVFNGFSILAFPSTLLACLSH